MIKEVNVEDLKSMITNGEDFQLIDVREPYEYEEKNMNGLLIPMGDIINQKDKIAADKKVVVHCKSGVRSANVVAYLQANCGMENLYNLKGGILAWLAAQK